MGNNELAWKIYYKLNEKGAELGNASVFIIEKVLDDYFKEHPASKKALDEALNEGDGVYRP